MGFSASKHRISHLAFALKQQQRKDGGSVGLKSPKLQLYF